MHTSIIYVTKKVIHWGANHPNDYYQSHSYFFTCFYSSCMSDRYVTRYARTHLRFESYSSKANKNKKAFLYAAVLVLIV